MLLVAAATRSVISFSTSHAGRETDAISSNLALRGFICVLGDKYV